MEGYIMDQDVVNASCGDCIYSRLSFSDQQDDPVFKCHRYPPQIFLDGDGEIAQAFPDAWMSCGEFTPAEKTRGVIGTLRKVQDHATRISNRVIGHLHPGNRRHRSLQDSGPADQPQDGVGP